MKNSGFTSPAKTRGHAFRRGVGLLLACLACFGAPGCKTRVKPEPVPQVEVNPAFEMNPPIAKEARIRKLTDRPEGNLLVEADFTEARLKSPLHAIQLSSGKVVLRDDGKGGDEKAGDGRYTVIFQEDLAAFTAEVESAQRKQQAVPAQARLRFVGRQLVKGEAVVPMKFDLAAFQAGKFVHLPFDLICRLLLDVSIDHSLMVRAVSVVEDPARTNNPCSATASATGAWSFGKLMTDMANTPVTGVTAEDFVKRWLVFWMASFSVNSDPVDERASLFDRVIRPWVVKSGSPFGSFNDVTWQTKPLNLAFAPFKLTAIVNRLDLRGNSGYGFANPGEGRFIFEVLNSTSCAPLIPGGFTVIFEYGIPIHDCRGLKNYAQRWYDLKTMPLGSPAYNDALQSLTDVFATANADPGKPNGSALNQIRTNEIAIASPWELREFNIDPTTHLPFQTTVKQEPAKRYNAKANPAGTPADVTLMADWVNANQADVIADRHTVPLNLPTMQAFLGAKAHTEPNGFWDAAPLQITGDDARHHFSLNTCSGCHGGETSTQFLHVRLAAFGSPAQLSGFLTGISVTDPAGRPAGSPTVRSFNDLERRRGSLEGLICTQCRSKFLELLEALSFDPVHMTH